jgi:hypothetical protein
MDAALERAKALLADAADGGAAEQEAEAVLRPWQDAGHAHVPFLLGVAFQKQGSFAQARDAYQRALRLEPSLISARTNLVHVLLALRELNEAVAHAEEASAREPRSADRLFLLACASSEAGDEARTLKALQRCVALNPRFVAAYVNLDALYLRRGDAQASRALAALALRESRASGGAFRFWNHELQRPPHMMQVRPRFVAPCVAPCAAVSMPLEPEQTQSFSLCALRRLRRLSCCLALCVPQGLRAQPWWDPRDFPWTAVLEAHANIIRGELAGMQQALVSVRGRSEHDGSLVSRGTWSEVVLLSGPGVLHRENCARAPRTAELLLQISAATSLAACGVGEALFSALAPGTRLRPHCGSTNARLTAHLGLVVGAGCGLRVGDELRTWQAGKCIVFDDSFVHEAFNEGEYTRIVLLVNFWHPGVPESQRAPLAALQSDAGAAPLRK